MKTAVVYNFDENYIEYAVTSIYSLCKKYTGSIIDLFCFVTPQMMDMENEIIGRIGFTNKINIKFIYSKKFFNLDISIPNTRKHIDSRHISNQAIQKCFFANELKDYDKIIYVDPDTLFLEDFNIILNYPMVNKFMAVQEYTYQNYLMYKNRHMPAFNSGMWIADLNYLREINFEDLSISYLNSKSMLAFMEQDIFNKFLLDKWHALPLSFNVFSWTCEDSYWTSYNPEPVMVHFVGSPKPLDDYDFNKDKCGWAKMFLDIHQETIK